MKFTANKAEILAAVEHGALSVDTKPTMPICATVRLVATSPALGSGSVHVAGTNLYRATTATASADVRDPGAVCVGAKDLIERLRTMPAGPVSIETTDKGVEIKSGARRHRVSTQSADDFPSLPEEPRDWAQVDAKALRHTIAAVRPAVSPDETRAALNAVLLETDGDHLVAVASDGARMHVSHSTIAPLGPEGLLSLPVADALVKAIDKIEGTIDLAWAPPNVTVRANGRTFSAKLVDARFPPWRQILPSAPKSSVGVSAPALVDALKSASIASSYKSGGVLLTFGGGEVRVTAESPDNGDSADTVPCDGNIDRRAGFAAKYLIDALTAAGVDVVKVGISGDLDPLMVSADGFAAAVMPMRMT